MRLSHKLRKRLAPMSSYVIKKVPANKHKIQNFSKFLEKKVFAFNERQAGPYHKRRFFVVAKDKNDRIIGGFMGYTFWGWLYVSVAWIDRKWRG